MANVGLRRDERIGRCGKEPGREHTRVCSRTQPRQRDLPRLLVPEDRERDQESSDNPEDDIFCAVLLFGFGHRRSTAYMKLRFKCRFDFLWKQYVRQRVAAAGAVPAFT